MSNVKELATKLEALFQEEESTTSENLDKRAKPSADHGEVASCGETNEFKGLHVESVGKKSSSDLFLRRVHDEKVPSFAASFELEDKQIQKAPSDLSCRKSKIPSDNFTVENLRHQLLFSNCKDFATKYNVIEKLGEGDSGTVYKGKYLFICMN